MLASRDWRGPDAVSLATLRKLYLGKRTRLAGRRITCFDLPLGHPVRGGFVRSVIRKTDRELEQYWIEQALTGGSLPPREVASAEEMVRAVGARRGAIGYLDATSFRRLAPDGVRILALEVEGRRLEPGSPDYPIRYLPESALREPLGDAAPPSRSLHAEGLSSGQP